MLVAMDFFARRPCNHGNLAALDGRVAAERHFAQTGALVNFALLYGLRRAFVIVFEGMVHSKVPSMM